MPVPLGGPSNSLGRAGRWLQEKGLLPAPHPPEQGLSLCLGPALVGTVGYWQSPAPGLTALAMPMGTGGARSSPMSAALPLPSPMGSLSPLGTRQGLPQALHLCLPPPAFPQHPQPRDVKKPLSHFSFLCAASVGPRTSWAPTRLLPHPCCAPACAHLPSPSPARDSSERRGGRRSPISLFHLCQAPEPLSRWSHRELPLFHRPS